MQSLLICSFNLTRSDYRPRFDWDTLSLKRDAEQNEIRVLGFGVISAATWLRI